MTMSMLLDYSVIFEDEQPLSIDEYLKGVTKAKLKMIASHFLGIDFRTSELNNWRELLKMWFREENNEFANKVWQRCEQLEKKHDSLTFLTPPAFLKFFEFVKTFSESPEAFDDITSERNLFIVYLLFLSQVTDKERVSEKYIKALPDNVRFAALILNQQFAYGEYANFQMADVFKSQIIKACYLFTFLENNEKASYLLKAFCDYYGLKKWQEFFQFIIPIIQAHTLHPKKGGWTHLDVTKDENFERNCFFLESLSQEADIESDFKSIRSNPLYKVSHGIYGIVYPLFVIEKIFKGSYFKIKELNESIPPDASFKVDWTQVYKQDFSESSLLYNVLEHIYEKRSYVRFSGDSLKVEDPIGTPDYYIRNGNDIYLFENKDVYINGNIRQAFDFEKLEQALKEKLYFSTEIRANGTIKTKAKAVMQLSRNIKKILTKANSYDKNYNEKKVRIYPILVLHDSSFECAGLNSYINGWFQVEIQNLRDEGIETGGVRKITIINIDTLILYADILRDKRQTLNFLIDEYINHSTFKPKKSIVTKEQLEQAYASTFEPFSIFIDNITKVQHSEAPGLLAKTMMSKIFAN